MRALWLVERLDKSIARLAADDAKLPAKNQTVTVGGVTVQVGDHVQTPTLAKEKGWYDFVVYAKEKAN